VSSASEGRIGPRAAYGINRVLVTGGGGFIGSHIVDLLTREGYDTGILDNFSTGDHSNVSHMAQVRIHEGDITDEGFVTKTVKGYDAVIHEAALVSVTRSVEDPIRTSRVNIDGTLNLLSAATRAGIKRFVFASSSSVYGETATLPKIESMNPQPISPYAVSKLAAENYCRVFARVHGLNTVCLRYFNVYGPRQKYGPYSGVIPAFVKKVLNNEEPVIFGKGTNTRDFTYVEDAARANLLCLQRQLEPGEVLNIGSGRQTQIRELAELIEELLGRPELGSKIAPPREGDIPHSYADISKAKNSLGYSPECTMREGLSKAIAWFRAEGSSTL
jgi:nucleoside-diphosphate-sugar epimerase